METLQCTVPSFAVTAEDVAAVIELMKGSNQVQTSFRMRYNSINNINQFDRFIQGEPSSRDGER